MCLEEREMERLTLGFWSGLRRPFSVLAPMEDVTDVVFRGIVRAEGAPDVFFTEFTSADGLCSAGRERVLSRLRYEPDQHPIVAQIWGLSPECFRRVAAELAQLGFDGIDINMGCPVRKIIRKGACGALIQNPSLAGELISAAREGAGPLPVSVKTRIGYGAARVDEWLGYLLQQRISVLTVHGRTVSQQSQGEADWGAVARAVRLRDQLGVETLVVGNGDVRTPELFRRRAAESGVDGVMIGRGVLENLFLFRALRAPEDGAADFSLLPEAAKIEYFLRHLARHQQVLQGRGFAMLKKFAKMYLRGFDGAARLTEALMRTRTYGEAEDLLASRLAVAPRAEAHAG